jgi:hypothetical protein
VPVTHRAPALSFTLPVLAGLAIDVVVGTPACLTATLLPWALGRLFAAVCPGVGAKRARDALAAGVALGTVALATTAYTARGGHLAVLVLATAAALARRRLGTAQSQSVWRRTHAMSPLPRPTILLRLVRPGGARGA